MVRVTGVEPVRLLPLSSENSMSTNSITLAELLFLIRFVENYWKKYFSKLCHINTLYSRSVQ